MKTIVLTIFGLAVLSAGKSQCTASVYANPKFIANDATVGIRSWGGLGNLVVSDNTYSSVTALVLGDNTHYLYCTDYGFNIPPTAIVCGIEVRVEKGAGGLLANVRDNSVRIIKSGSIVGSEHAVSTSWPGSDVTVTYGSSSDTWGQSWTPADVNASSFGIAFSANLGGVAVLPNARIDQISIRIWYNNILPVELTRFEAGCTGEQVLLQWETASEIQNNYFAVQHSTDGQSFATVKTISGNGTTNTPHTYACQHLPSGNSNQHYYRLVQHDFNGDSVVYTPQNIECSSNVEAMDVYQPAPGRLNITLNGFTHDVQVLLVDLSGHVLYSQTTSINSERQQLQLDGLPALDPGCYVVTALSGGKNHSKKLMVVK